MKCSDEGIGLGQLYPQNSHSLKIENINIMTNNILSANVIHCLPEALFCASSPLDSPLMLMTL